MYTIQHIMLAIQQFFKKNIFFVLNYLYVYFIIFYNNVDIKNKILKIKNIYYFNKFIKKYTIKIGNGGSGSNFGAVINTLTLARSFDYQRL